MFDFHQVEEEPREIVCPKSGQGHIINIRPVQLMVFAKTYVDKLSAAVTQAIELIYELIFQERRRGSKGMITTTFCKDRRVFMDKVEQ